MPIIFYISIEKKVSMNQQKEDIKDKKRIWSIIGNVCIALSLILFLIYLIPSYTGGNSKATIGSDGSLSVENNSGNEFLSGLSSIKKNAINSLPDNIRNAGKRLADKSKQSIPIDPNANLYENGDESLLIYSDENGDRPFAPAPAHQFRNATCDLSAKNEEKPHNNEWVIPSINQRAQWGLSGFNNSLISIPPAPLGAMYASDALFGDREGALLQLGHVNYNENPWAVSPWGYLYQLQECAHIYQTDSNGNTYEFVVTDLYTVSHEDFPKSDEYFRKDGDLALYMVTCSGPRVGDAGLSFTSTQSGWDLGYEYNLVVKAVPVH